MPVTRRSPTRSQQEYDEKASRFSCGDVSSTASALRVAGSQEVFKQNFVRDLEAAGVVVRDVHNLHDEFEFVVTDARARAESQSRGKSQYPEQIFKKHPFAVYTPENPTWYLPYQKTTGDDWMAVISGMCGSVFSMAIGSAFVCMGVLYLSSADWSPVYWLSLYDPVE